MPISKDKFKNSSGVYITKALFFEETKPSERNRHLAVYTLKDEDIEREGVIYPSLKRLFLECDDPTEYEFASTHLYGWDHWKAIQDCGVLQEHIEKWREIRDVKLMSENVKNIRAMAADGSFSAAKWMVDRGYEKRPNRGRPSKAEKKQAAKEHAEKKSRVERDAERVGLYAKPKRPEGSKLTSC